MADIWLANGSNPPLAHPADVPSPSPRFAVPGTAPWNGWNGRPKTDSRDAKITTAAGAEMPAAEAAASVQEPTVKDLFTTQQTCAGPGAPRPRSFPNPTQKPFLWVTKLCGTAPA